MKNKLEICNETLKNGNGKITKEEALCYHEFPTSGKLAVETKVPFATQRDLSLAYTPGVAEPCKEIAKNPHDAYKYTSKSNLVAVISNGTAVLGLGNIGALASKPVMEGKSVLFKNFGALDSFDVEVDDVSVDGFCKTVEAISPTFGGINLEDIKAPECFEIEKRLIETVDIPVMHDDQHGTAIITSAGLMNACEITGRKLEEVKIVIVGAGAAAISSAKMYKHLGVKNIVMIDSKGVIHKGREVNKYKSEFAVENEMTQKEAFTNADMVLGLSAPNSFTVEDVKLMAERPIVFSLANPIPEVFPEDVKAVRSDAIVATGRSDFPNQVNNVLGFPFIFRGALDVHAKSINIEMKLSASKALANLAKQPVPEEISKIYGGEKFEFGEEYIIPKPFDKRLIVEVSSAVAKSAFETGVAQIEKFNYEKYREELSQL
jgi:malate dehydrogenase (oxaloacetate-decarboxylating)(NADP+)